jgi:surfactin synthase thioesterase subunit
MARLEEGSAMDEGLLVCLPFAGAGASFFRKWQARLPQRLLVLPVRLPGREGRLSEPAPVDAACAADEAFAQVTRQVPPGGDAIDVLVFGHSMGAILAFELAHRLATVPEVRLAGLLVSGSPGPRHRTAIRVSGLPDGDFLLQLQRLTGYKHPAFDDCELRALLTPLLRADTRIMEDYRCTQDTPLTCPITSIRGSSDSFVSADQAGQWVRETTGSFRYVELDGGHMYLAIASAALLGVISSDLR